MQPPTLQQQFGAIDIYLFDQILKGRIAPGSRILDAGCGGGRNLVYLLRNAPAERYEIFGADADEHAIDSVRHMASTLAPNLPPWNFRHESVEEMSFAESFADVVISSAVLHFAASENQFDAMLAGSWRALAPGGLFFCRLASSIGIERQLLHVTGRRHRLPDGSERYLVDEELLIRLTNHLGGQLLDPIKTTVVQNQRSMTTWVIRKNQ